MNNKLKVIILTSSTTGTPAYFIPILHENANIHIVSIVVNTNTAGTTKKSKKKRLSKIFKIGFLGAINGIRMRRWFGEMRDNYLPKINLVNYCNTQGININYVPSINCGETIELFTKADADLGISIGNSYISKKIFSVPAMGMINTHGEILPDYQNAQSVIWQIYNSSKNTGFTIHKINSKIDQGEILYQEKITLKFKETLSKTVAYNCAEITKKSAEGLVKLLNNFDYYFNNAKIQGNGSHYTTPTIWQFLTIYKNYKRLKKQSQ